VMLSVLNNTSDQLEASHRLNPLDSVHHAPL
jgi:hypothetical protein